MLCPSRIRESPGHACARTVHDVGQVVEQTRGRGQTTARPRRFPMAALVIAPHGKAPLVQPPRHVVVAPGMFAQTVHEDDHATQRYVVGQRPVLNDEVVAVGGDKRR